MSKTSFQNIQAYFCDSSDLQSNQIFQQVKDEEASTLTTSKDKKLLKNRISAQHSRLKKKKFIQDLQNNERRLLEQIERTERQIDKSKQQLNNFLTKNKENDSFNHDEKPTYERLKKLIRQQQHFDEDEANMLIQLLISRVGVTGKERRRMVEYYTKRLVNFSIPAIYRYFLQSSTENKGLLSNSDQDLFGWDKQIFQKLVIDQKQKSQLTNMKSRMKRQKSIWVKKIQQFNSIREQIYQTSMRTQQEIMNLKDLFTTKQTGQVIVSVENRKYNQQISMEKGQVNQNPVKKVKTK